MVGCAHHLVSYYFLRLSKKTHTVIVATMIEHIVVMTEQSDVNPMNSGIAIPLLMSIPPAFQESPHSQLSFAYPLRLGLSGKGPASECGGSTLTYWYVYLQG
jgi:hypothetical protein